MKTLRASPLCLLVLAACSKPAEPAPPAGADASGAKTAEKTGEKGAEKPAEKAAETPEELVKQMNTAIDELMKKAEHKDDEVTIQHILVGVANSGTGATRSPGEAETLAAQLYARAKAGENFDTLVKNNTNDAAPGIYVLSLTRSDKPRLWRRDEMVAAFGDVAWRLQVGEFGVAPYDKLIPGKKPKSPFGYHIIKRLK